MGSEATITEAKWMLQILLQSGFCNIETSAIPCDEWLEMCETAARFAHENPDYFKNDR